MTQANAQIPLSEPTPLVYGDNVQNNKTFRLLELHDDVLQALKRGDSLCIKGAPDQDAVLATATQSFAIKQAGTSNTLLVAMPRVQKYVTSPSQDNQDNDASPMAIDGEEAAAAAFEVASSLPILASCHEYLEALPCKPRLDQLDALINERRYAGEDQEDSNPAGKYSLEEICNRVQASEQEIVRALEQSSALLIHGKWRAMDFAYAHLVLDLILKTITEHDWSYRKVPLELSAQDLEPHGISRDVVEHCLRTNGRELPTESEANESGSATERYFEMSADKICRLCALYLLKQGKRWQFDEFMEAWQSIVPPEFVVELALLQGLALHEGQGQQRFISYFNAQELPTDPAARFSSLFKMRPRWTHADILPYVNDLTTPKETADALLLKYARGSTDNTNTRWFNAR
ncbi:hypothetical protein CAOG_04241 [Capsaspora owczarzaki ATCC 30864]|uniref:Sister chromatid cohesion protein DCC1 n=1 Tax=Capsaspora owczarzaki (strain ATCC 30864) TaxID=595528 RepID=A0A0D2VRG1_CAPO3|nr:hypothetical protein CAOG_04241 [Capsaspora owczarzaki ATCC 30864]KJE93452.1 hypothetical protein CAOG_004241 [Capsaspora owczarzaki ATCC 30864]|eukprot:XP_004348066.2 hypothetical protein CAOG_04241 [Capsaspora owczarzaki ATCC 30864]